MKKIVVCGALFGVISLAQDPALQEKKKLDELSMQKLEIVSGQMLPGKTVKGSPYSAQATSEMVQVLADGNRITHSNTSQLYRDSQGRERREETFGNGATRSVFIADPVENVNYTLEPGSKTAHKNTPRAIFFNSGTGRGGSVGTGISVGGSASVGGAGGSRVVTDSFFFTTNGPGDEGQRLEVSSGRINVMSKDVDRKEESLGMRVIEGVSAEGTRTTTTIPAGSMGNEQPIITVSERWYSPDLQVVVMSTRSDPRTGTTTYKLTNISRSEPALTLFQVPSDYTVTEGPRIKSDMIEKFEQDQR
jgi:hypothetical protein